ncbi:MAG: hypothetical protein O2794_00420 [bacterium]|nr:hypothetical protein [bacterium]
MRSLKAAGLLIGMIVGAGIFALPFAVFRGGLYWSLFHFALAISIVTVLHLLYGKMFYDHRSRHHLPGYVKQYYGKYASRLVVVSRLLSYYGYLLAYSVLGGIFLSNVLPVGKKTLTIIIFLVLSPVVYANLRKAGSINFFLTIPLVAFPVLLFLVLAPELSFKDVPLMATGSDWFFPYGVFLFALSGASVIPEVVNILGKYERKHFSKVIIGSAIVVSLIYFLYIASILGIAGGEVSSDSLSVLASQGSLLLGIGSLIGLLAIVTSFIALGLELRLTFQYDLRFKRLHAWLLTVSIPLGLFLLGLNDFVLIIGIIGAIGIGIEGTFIVLLSHKISKTNIALVATLIGIFALGALFEIATVVGIL